MHAACLADFRRTISLLIVELHRPAALFRHTGSCKQWHSMWARLWSNKKHIWVTDHAGKWTDQSCCSLGIHFCEPSLMLLLLTRKLADRTTHQNISEKISSYPEGHIPVSPLSSQSLLETTSQGRSWCTEPLSPQSVEALGCRSACSLQKSAKKDNTIVA